MLTRRTSAALLAVLGALAAAPAAHAATLTVDDDGADCPAAKFQTIQNAIYAAAEGDTVAVCPGRYVEGSGAVGSNGLIIADDVTIKGAGADLVRIVPRHTTAAGGQIAAATPDVRDDRGAIVMIDGDSEDRQANATKTHVTRVDISGVTIDGDGVYAEAGVVFRDASGSISRSRITNLVTTERSLDAPRPGEYKGSPDGFGVAQVTAGAGAVFGAVARQVRIDHTRIDKYNAAGVLIDSATGDTLPLTASGITSLGTLIGNQIVGRTLCVDYLVDGDCQPDTPPATGLPTATNGPLYGQDGVRITAGASGTLTDNTITQNLVQGAGSPVRGLATNTGTLWMAASVRLIGAGASTLTHNNLVDSSYGVYNATLDGRTANTAVPARAEDNWWGLRTSAVAGNPGPAISPATNPPVPETAVNGAPVADGAGTSSDAVDFFPYRNGFQSDPDSGELPVVDAPLPVNDAAPAVTLATDQGTYRAGDRVTLTASPSDDIGVKRVQFFDGALGVGAAITTPYRAGYTLAPETCGTTRTLTAVVEDSAGQTASATTTVAVTCAAPAPAPAPGGGTPAPAPSAVLTVSLGAVPARVSAAGFLLTPVLAASRGVRSLDVYLGARRVCSLTRAPFTCRVKPTGADVGTQSLRVVVTDGSGASAESSRRITVARFKPAGLRLSVATRGTRATVSGRLRLPGAVTAAQGCRSGSVAVVVARGARTLSDAQVKLRSNCRFRKRVARTGATLKVTARFRGNAVLQATTTTRRFK